ncbi:MAG TPA: hypothetical protein VGG28_21300 [Kofleriaceae bacterium]|jgi:hypothetical protein
MRALLLALIAACSFNPSPQQAAPNPPDDGPPMVTQDDAPAEGIHDDVMVTPHDAKIDAPADACPDSDGDGICDDDDTWPCGAEPTAPPSTVTMTVNGNETKIVISNIVVDGKTGRQIVDAPGTTVNVTFHYAITDTSCPENCADQIEIGWIPGHRQGCPFDDGVSKSMGASGDIATTITLPSGSGDVDLRGNIGQNYSCTYNNANDWWGAAPGSNRTLANVCVH